MRSSSRAILRADEELQKSPDAPDQCLGPNWDLAHRLWIGFLVLEQSTVCLELYLQFRVDDLQEIPIVSLKWSQPHRERSWFHICTLSLTLNIYLPKL